MTNDDGQSAEPEAVLAANVRRMRLDRGWTQLQVIRELEDRGVEISQPTLTKLEQAGRPIRVNELFALADIFETTVQELLGLPVEGTPVDVTAVRTKAAQEEVQHMIDQLHERRDHLARRLP